jgi:hypothetical protein
MGLQNYLLQFPKSGKIVPVIPSHDKTQTTFDLKISSIIAIIQQP